MKPKHLKKYDVKRLRDYFSSKWINIVFEQTGNDEKSELRGMYKGYLYGMKFFNDLLIREKRIMNYEISHYFKFYKSHRTTLWGESKAIFDILKLLCE